MIKILLILFLSLLSCASKISLSPQCNFPDSVIEKGGLIKETFKFNEKEKNIFKKNISCYEGAVKKIITPISFFSDDLIYAEDGIELNNRIFRESKIIIKALNNFYPKVPIPLNYKNTFTLLISVLLSAQCTDVNVNNVTKTIYPKYNKPIHFVKLGRKKIESLIRRIGIFRVKAKSIFYLSKTLVEKYNGRVPNNYEELEQLPGVGHKTASVVMSQGFGFPAFPVDTHIHRLAQRWGLTNGKNVVQTEKDLKSIFPRKYWNRLHLQIIWYGREYCKARDCYGLTCKICKSCYPKRKKPVKTKKA